MSEFDKEYWEDHWASDNMGEADRLPVNPYLLVETDRLTPGTALEAGCGEGTEALWLAERGWQVTGADISTTALATARERGVELGLADRVEWVEADLMRWEHERQWDLVATHYAHADLGQLALYEQLSQGVAPGGTLLIVGHASGHGHAHDVPHGERHQHGHGHDHGGDGGRGHHGSQPPEAAIVTIESMKDLFSGPEWRIDAAYENTRTIHPSGREIVLNDVVFRVYRNLS